MQVRKAERNQVSGRVSIPYWHATSVANAPWKPLIIGEGQARDQDHEIGGTSDWLGEAKRTRYISSSYIYLSIQHSQNETHGFHGKLKKNMRAKRPTFKFKGYKVYMDVIS